MTEFWCMCVTRVGKVISVQGTRAIVRILDTGAIADINVSLVDAKKNAYLEIFADSAIGSLNKREAEWKSKIRSELMSR
jgi:hypothetical protein